MSTSWKALNSEYFRAGTWVIAISHEPPPSRNRFAFRHGLVRETAYGVRPSLSADAHAPLAVLRVPRDATHPRPRITVSSSVVLGVLCLGYRVEMLSRNASGCAVEAVIDDGTRRDRAVDPLPRIPMYVDGGTADAYQSVSCRRLRPGPDQAGSLPLDPRKERLLGVSESELRRSCQGSATFRSLVVQPTHALGYASAVAGRHFTNIHSSDYTCQRGQGTRSATGKPRASVAGTCKNGGR